MSNDSSVSVGPRPLDAYVARKELEAYAQIVSDTFGFHALQIGWSEHDLLDQCRIPYKFSAQCEAQPNTALLCESEFLPFAEQAVDLVCMPHVLEQCGDPQQTLREVFRILVPEGTLVLSGISPLSCLGLRTRLSCFHQSNQFHRLFSARRIRDWLNVLGFEVTLQRHLVHAFPINKSDWLSRQSWLEQLGEHAYGMMGGIYFLVAKKRVLNIRVLKPEWKMSQVNHAMQVRKGRASVQKQLKCMDVDTEMDRNIR